MDKCVGPKGLDGSSELRTAVPGAVLSRRRCDVTHDSQLLSDGIREPRRLGVKLRFDDLRHFTATQLIGAGVDVRTVAGRLGQRDPSVTLRIYSSFIEEPDRRAGEIMGTLVASPQQEPPSKRSST